MAREKVKGKNRSTKQIRVVAQGDYMEKEHLKVLYDPPQDVTALC